MAQVRFSLHRRKLIANRCHRVVLQNRLPNEFSLKLLQSDICFGPRHFSITRIGNSTRSTRKPTSERSVPRRTVGAEFFSSFSFVSHPVWEWIPKENYRTWKTEAISKNQSNTIVTLIVVTTEPSIAHSWRKRLHDVEFLCWDRSCGMDLRPLLLIGGSRIKILYQFLAGTTTALR